MYTYLYRNEVLNLDKHKSSYKQPCELLKRSCEPFLMFICVGLTIWSANHHKLYGFTMSLIVIMQYRNVFYKLIQVTQSYSDVIKTLLDN